MKLTYLGLANAQVRDLHQRSLIKHIEVKDHEVELPCKDMAPDGNIEKKFPLAPSARKRGGGVVPKPAALL